MLTSILTWPLRAAVALVILICALPLVLALCALALIYITSPFPRWAALRRLTGAER